MAKWAEIPPLAVGQPASDLVNKPPHYNSSSIECIDAMAAMSENTEMPSHAAYCWQNEDLTLEDFRWGLIQEEYGEAFDESCNRNNPENMLKECLDLLAVTVGYCATYGWDVEEGFRRVHQSNMSKLGLDGKPIKNSEGKVLKGPNYQPANLSDLVRTNNE